MSWNKLRLIAAVAVVTTGTLGFVVGQWAAADLPKLNKPAAAADAKKELPVAPLPAALPERAKPDDTKPAVPARRREAVIRLPSGTFTKEADAGQYGSGRMTWTYDDDRVTGTIEANVMGVEVEITTEAEISLSSNGTIYGLITSAKVTKLKLGGLAAELQQFAGMVSLAEPLLNELLTDMPFSYQFRVSGDRLTILSYRIMLAGPNPIVKYVALMGDGANEIAAFGMYFGAIGTAIEGTYTAIDPDQPPSKRPARKAAAKKGE